MHKKLSVAMSRRKRMLDEQPVAFLIQRNVFPGVKIPLSSSLEGREEAF